MIQRPGGKTCLLKTSSAMMSPLISYSLCLSATLSKLVIDLSVIPNFLPTIFEHSFSK
jgi:hypothetical protein